MVGRRLGEGYLILENLVCGFMKLLHVSSLDVLDSYWIVTVLLNKEKISRIIPASRPWNGLASIRMRSCMIVSSRSYSCTLAALSSPPGREVYSEVVCDARRKQNKEAFRILEGFGDIFFSIFYTWKIRRLCGLVRIIFYYSFSLPFLFRVSPRSSDSSLYFERSIICR